MMRNQRLLNDSSNTARTYSTSTFTLPVLALSLSSTMFFIDFMLFLGTIYIMYFYFPKLLEPFWSHLDSNTSIVICPSFCHNNSYETESIICSTYWNWTKSLRDGLPRLWRSFSFSKSKSSGNQVLQVVLLSHHNQQSNRIDITTAYEKINT